MVGVEFESCPRCSGVWLDQGELKALTRSRGGEALQVEVSVELQTQFFCPICKPPCLLFECQHSLPPDFTLDVCGRCGGIWFDEGEFPSLLRR